MEEEPREEIKMSGQMISVPIRMYPPESPWNEPASVAQIRSMNDALRILKRPEVTEMNRPATKWQARDAMKELWDDVAAKPRVQAALIKKNRETAMAKEPVIKCECISSILNHRLQFALGDKINDEKDKVKQGLEHINKYPGMAKRADDIITNDPQYQKGLVLGRDLYGDYAGSSIVMEELKKSIAESEELLGMLKTIPDCKE